MAFLFLLLMVADAHLRILRRITKADIEGVFGASDPVQSFEAAGDTLRLALTKELAK